MEHINVAESADGNMVMTHEEAGENRRYQKDTFSLHYKTEPEWQILSNYCDRLVRSVRNC